ncbi:hypothetical protein Oscil6304_4816 [Oscillatoria acuminata PCC 6304]|uniref:Uncharacterized protein n=1 Tax=Oscillatoria acuminata PCC 6304 TaxID=56110 RepID=K9TQR3_9CYAN|nr:hypothetical protein Oscil6304_4816 [Oscillatoria acuminata PCC 6304]
MDQQECEQTPSLWGDLAAKCKKMNGINALNEALVSQGLYFPGLVGRKARLHQIMAIGRLSLS